MIEHEFSQGPFQLLQRLARVWRTDLFDAASAHLLVRAGYAAWDRRGTVLCLTNYGLGYRSTAKLIGS